MNSSRVRGRMRSARGCCALGISASREFAGVAIRKSGKRLIARSRKQTRWHGAARSLDVGSGCGVSLAGSFVKEDGGGSGGVERFNATGHGDADARVRAAFHFAWQTVAFVADEQRHGLAPIDLPRREERSVVAAGFMNAGRKRADASDFELRQQNRERHP